jgi:hypothetical protein
MDPRRFRGRAPGLSSGQWRSRTCFSALLEPRALCSERNLVSWGDWLVVRCVSGAAALFLAGSIASAEPYQLNGGRWDGTRVTGAIDFFDEQAIGDCLAGESVTFSNDQIAAMIEPSGTCQVGEPSEAGSGADFGLTCTGGQIVSGDVQVEASAEKIEINAEVEFPLDDGSTLDGYILLSMERTGVCSPS